MSAPVFEAVTSGVVDNAITKTIVSPAIIAANFALISLHWERDATIITNIGVTFDGNGCTHIGSRNAGGAPWWGISMWYYANPGDQKNVVASWTNIANGVVLACRNYTRVGRDPIRTFASADGNGVAIAVNVASVVGELVVDAAVQNTDAAAAGAGQTERLETHDTAVLGMGSEEAGATTVAMTWTGNHARIWVTGGVSLKPILGATQAIIVMSKIQDFYDQLKGGLLSPDILQRRYREVWQI